MITIPLWAFILLCIGALPVALCIVFGILLGICMFIFFVLSLFIKYDDYEEERL